MFGFKQDVKQELNNIWAHINTLQKWAQKIENTVPTFNKTIDSMWEQINILQKWARKIENAVPTFNKTIEKQKKLEEFCATILAIAEKMDQKIRKMETKENSNKKKGK